LVQQVWFIVTHQTPLSAEAVGNRVRLRVLAGVEGKQAQQQS
jgi:hypothetical protein